VFVSEHLIIDVRRSLTGCRILVDFMAWVKVLNIYIYVGLHKVRYHSVYLRNDCEYEETQKHVLHYFEVLEF